MNDEENFIEIPFGARDSETLGWEYTIPDDMEAKIENGKIIVRKKESEDEKVPKLLYKLLCGEVTAGQFEKYGLTIDSALFWLEKQKPVEWSEEDDQFLLVCKNALAKYQVSDKWDANIISRWLENKLKSLQPQPKQDWRPSDEQLDIIEMILTDEAMDDNIHSILETLHNDLKKLREK